MPSAKPRRPRSRTTCIRVLSSVLLAAVVLLAMVACWPRAAEAQPEQAVYKRARADYHWLVNHPQARKVYHNWQSLKDRFARVYTANPQGPLASGSLFWMARIHKDAYAQFKRQQDFNEAVDLCQRLISHFPKNRLADDAQYMIGRLYEKAGDPKHAYLEYLKVTVNYPRGDMLKRAKARLDALEKELVGARIQAEKEDKAKKDKQAKSEAAKPDATLADVTDLRHWSTPTYTRVVLTLERPVPYTANLLKKNQKAGKPRRLYIDLRGARLTEKVQETVPIGDGLLVRARAGQFKPDTVRLVLDTKHLASYKVFSLDNPFRLVVDCFGKVDKPKAKLTYPKSQRVPRGRAKQKPPQLGLAAALGLTVKRVVLDPGHGGKDPGAIWRGLHEKDITLDVTRRVARKLAKLLGCKVLLTRNRDKFLALEARTAFANTQDADLFVSFHVNAAPSHRLSGLETYFLNFASDEESMRVAARENATSQRSISDLQVILNDLIRNTKINESNRLARSIHKKLVSEVRKQHKVRDLKVKQAPFYVLIGARMPAALVELGFITNPTEHRLLGSERYRELLAEGVAKGIADYARKLKRTDRAG
ncbi:MAG: N-acetylmuramoyl-L-alanine amidase [Desulfarculaceae bacterium]